MKRLNLEVKSVTVAAARLTMLFHDLDDPQRETLYVQLDEQGTRKLLNNAAEENPMLLWEALENRVADKVAAVVRSLLPEE